MATRAFIPTSPRAVAPAVETLATHLKVGAAPQGPQVLLVMEPAIHGPHVLAHLLSAGLHDPSTNIIVAPEIAQNTCAEPYVNSSCPVPRIHQAQLPN